MPRGSPRSSPLQTSEQAGPAPPRSKKPALIFDLDGTLVDSVYQHVEAWSEALETKRIRVPRVKIHRGIGMSGTLLLRSVFNEFGIKASSGKLEALEKAHKKSFDKKISSVQPTPGAAELLELLTRNDVAWAIATTGEKEAAQRMMKPLRVASHVPVVTGDDVEQAKPHPDVFIAAAMRLGVPLADCTVIGDSVWDLLAAQRAKAVGVGVLTGGYSVDELASAGAFRIYENPGNLLQKIAELGVSPD